MKGTQTDRLVDFLRDHPGSSSLEITLAIGCVNVTGRVSDARKAGHDVIAKRDLKGVFRYWLVEKRKATSGEQLGWTA